MNASLVDFDELGIYDCINEDRDTIRFGFVIVDDKIIGKGYGKRTMKHYIMIAWENSVNVLRWR